MRMNPTVIGMASRQRVQQVASFVTTPSTCPPAPAAISIWNGQKNTDNILVENNLVTGGGFSIYAEDYSPSEANPVGGYTMTNVRFVNNRFSNRLSGCVGEWGIWFYRGSATWPYHGGPTGDWGANGNIRSGNTIIETGYNLDGGNPPGCT